MVAVWALFSILAALSWAISDIIDKFVLTKWVKTPMVPVIILGFVGLIASIGIYFIYGFSSLSYFNIFLALVAGIFNALMVVFYFKAVKIEEVSRVVPLFNFVPLFILLLATIFLGEIFTPLKYLGIFLVVGGAVLISIKDFSAFKISKAFFWILLGSFIISITAVLIKYLLNFTDYLTIFAYNRIGVFIGIIPIAYFYIPELKHIIKTHGKKVAVVMSVSEIINLIGLLLITIATSFSAVSLVATLAATEPFFVLSAMVFLSVFYPRILHEEIGKSTILVKLGAIILMFIGAVLII